MYVLSIHLFTVECIPLEKKSKQADSEKRQIARRAREDHKRSMRRSLKTESQIVGMLSLSLQKVRDGKENVKPPVARSVGHVLHRVLGLGERKLCTKAFNILSFTIYFKALNTKPKSIICKHATFCMF